MKTYVPTIALLLATLAACRSAVFPIVPVENPQAALRGVEVVRAGTYSLGKMATQRDASGVLQNAIPNPRFVQRAATIRAKIGVTFGFQFKVTGVPDGAWVTLRIVTRYPRPGATPPGAAHPLRITEQSLRRKLNRVIEAGYTLQEPWELIPGRWAIEVWSGDRKLGEQEFTLVPNQARGPSGLNCMSLISQGLTWAILWRNRVTQQNATTWFSQKACKDGSAVIPTPSSSSTAITCLTRRPESCSSE